jgi:YVTN family beta-propeller protein
VLSSDGSRLYVSNTHDDTLSVIDTTSSKVIATTDVGTTPEGVGFSRNNNQIYVASWMENEVTVVDAETNKVVARIPTGKESRAFGLFILEDR